MSKKFILKNSDLLEYNEQVQEGEYNIFYKKKIIKRFVIIKDKPPEVKFITKPEISKKYAAIRGFISNKKNEKENCKDKNIYISTKKINESTK